MERRRPGGMQAAAIGGPKVRRALWLAAAWLPIVSEAKVQTGPVRISGPRQENHWKYISKFGYSIGEGTFHIRVRLQQPKTVPAEVAVQLEVHIDEDWPEVEEMADVCSRRTRSRQTRQLLVHPGGEWGPWVNGSLDQTIRPHIWYFAVSDCEGGLQNFTHRLQFEFLAKQYNGSEFSIEMRGMLLANLLYLLGFTGFIWYFSKKTIAFSRSAGCVHPVIWTLWVSVAIQYLAQVLHTIHLILYSYDGAGVKALEVFSEILSMLSQVTQTSLLILIALGYTLLQSRIGELDLMIPMCFMVGVIHIMLVGFGKIQDDASYKFHENEGVIGWILLAMRLLLYLWFLWAVQSSASEGGFKLKSFLQQFRAAGSIYFLAYPSIFIVTQLFAPYLQHGVMSVGLMCMQAGSNVWLGTIFLTRGEYFKVSTLSASDLPGGCKVGLVKEE